MNSFSESVSIYKALLEKGDVQVAYTGLVKFVMKLKATFSKSLADQFSFGSIFHGYIDYTYFYFSNAYLKGKKLRFGLVLNHEKMRFEIWLLGQNIKVQDKYWDVLKGSKWNEGRLNRPEYAVLEAVLVENPDFSDLDVLSEKIENELVPVAAEIVGFLKSIEP